MTSKTGAISERTAKSPEAGSSEPKPAAKSLTSAASPKSTASAEPTARVHEDHNVIEIDDEESATESVFGSVAESSTASITSSILKYRQENGRTYHAYKDGKYLYPNDYEEQLRLEMQHHLCLLTFDQELFLSPAGKNGHELRNVLDIGTGTGIWAVDFGNDFPSASVIGVDLSPIQSNYVPPNVSFQVFDVEEEWDFHVKFDFVYSRMMTGSLANWPHFIGQAYKSLAPNGWFEVCDLAPLTSDDGTLSENTAAKQWMDKIIAACNTINRPGDSISLVQKQMEECGFKNVHTVKLKWPQNTWPKESKFKELGAYSPISSDAIEVQS